MGDEIEKWTDPKDRLPALIDYLKGDQVRRAVESGQPIINITINEAARPAPAPPPPENIATRYAGHLVLITWSAVVLGGLAVALLMIAPTIMAILGSLTAIIISVAVCALAVAAAIGFLKGMLKTETKERARARKGRRF